MHFKAGSMAPVSVTLPHTLGYPLVQSHCKTTFHSQPRLDILKAIFSKKHFFHLPLTIFFGIPKSRCITAHSSSWTLFHLALEVTPAYLVLQHLIHQIAIFHLFMSAPMMVSSVSCLLVQPSAHMVPDTVQAFISSLLNE